jgi:pyrophosphatase PpaX
MSKLKGILFDLDGTLRDSREAILSAIEQVFAEIGIPQPPSEELNQHTHHLESVRSIFAPHHSAQDFLERYDAHIEPLRARIALYPHTREVLTQLKNDGYQLGLASSARWPQQWAEENDLLPLFGAIIGANDTEKHKPDPEPVLKALDELGLPADEVIMVGDLAADIEAARGAHLYAAVGIMHGFGSREVLEQAGADYSIESLDALPELVERLDRELSSHIS